MSIPTQNGVMFGKNGQIYVTLARIVPAILLDKITTVALATSGIMARQGKMQMVTRFRPNSGMSTSR